MFLTSRSLCSYRGLCWALISRKRIELFSVTFSIRLPRRYRFKSLYFKSGHKLLAFIKLAVIIKMERNDHISPPVQRGVERQLITSWNKLLTPNAKRQDDHNQSKNRCRYWEKLHLITSNVTTTTTTGTASYLYHLHGKTGWKIEWFAPFSLGSFRKYGLWFKAVQFFHFF